MFLLGFFFTYLLILIFNWLGNDSALFPSPLHPAITERSWKTRRIDAQIAAGSAPDVFILGSSRVMQVQPAYLQALTGGKAFNYGVSAGGLIDTLTQLRYLVSRGVKLKVVVLGIDEFAFSNTVSHHKLQLAAHSGLLTHIPYPENIFIIGEILTNMTPDGTWDSMTATFKPLGVRNDKLSEVSSVLLEDGYLIYNQSTQEKAAGKYDARDIIIKNAHRFRSRIRSFSGPDDNPLIIRPRQWEMFEQILDLAKARGADVRVVLLPVHPDFERIVFYGRERQMRSRISGLMANACARRGLIYRDFTSLASYGGDPNEFWDGMHQTSENTRRMMNVLFGHAPEEIIIKLPSDLELLRNLPSRSSLNTW